MEISLYDGAPDMHEVFAWMVFPANEELRNTYRTRLRLGEVLERASPTAVVTATAAEIASVLGGPSRSDIAKLASDGVKAGHVAGLLLRHVYESHARGIAEPSLNKAIKFYSRAALGAKFRDGEPLAYSEATIRKHWAHAMPSAHLWAALEFTKTGAPTPEGVAFGPGLFQEVDQQLFLLGMARAIADFATSFVPRRTRPAKPVVPLETLVRISPDIPAITLSFTQNE